MSEDPNRVEEHMARKHQPLNDDYLSRVLTGQVISIDNVPEHQNTTPARYEDHTKRKK